MKFIKFILLALAALGFASCASSPAPPVINNPGSGGYVAPSK